MTLRHPLQTGLTRRTLLRRAFTIAGAAGSIAIAGCGDSDDDDDATDAPSVAPGTTPAQPTPQAGARWAQVMAAGPGPSARRDHSLTAAANGNVYLFGGRARGVSNNELWQLDPANATWEPLASEGDSPEPRFGHNAFYDGTTNRLVIAAGQADATTFFNDVWAYDPEATTWSRIDVESPDRPAPRYGAGGAHSINTGVILISHGFTDTGRFDDTWNFALADGTWAKIETTGTPPIKRCLLRTLWVPGRKEMLLFGGQTDSNPFLGDFWAMSDRGEWTEKKPAVLPGPRNLYGASLGDRGARWYIVGGNTPDGPSDEVWAYDLSEDAWSRLEPADGSPALPARFGTDAAIVDGVLYAFGGYDGSSELDDLWALTLA